MTAVEWLKSKIIEDIRLDDLICGYYSKEQYKLFLLDKIEQALIMEKEQIIEAYHKGFIREFGNRDEDVEKYYNETYKPSVHR